MSNFYKDLTPDRLALLSEQILIIKNKIKTV